MQQNLLTAGTRPRLHPRFAIDGPRDRGGDSTSPSCYGQIMFAKAWSKQDWLATGYGDPEVSRAQLGSAAGRRPPIDEDDDVEDVGD